MQDQKGCKKDNIRADEEQITAARTKQHEEEEKHTDIRPQMTKDKYIYKYCLLYTSDAADE